MPGLRPGCRGGRLLWCRPPVWVDLHRFGARLVSGTRPRRRLGRRALVWLHGNGLGSHLASSMTNIRSHSTGDVVVCTSPTCRVPRALWAHRLPGPLREAPAPRRSGTAGAVVTGGAALRPTREGSAHLARSVRRALVRGSVVQRLHRQVVVWRPPVRGARPHPLFSRSADHHRTGVVRPHVGGWQQDNRR